MSTISSISKKYHISASKIRYYESEGLIKIQRNSLGNRTFDPKTEDVLRILIHLNQAGLSIAEMRDNITNLNNHDYEIALLEASQLRLLKKIRELNASLKFLDFKIDYHKKNSPDILDYSVVNKMSIF